MNSVEFANANSVTNQIYDAVCCPAFNVMVLNVPSDTRNAVYFSKERRIDIDFLRQEIVMSAIMNYVNDIL